MKYKIEIKEIVNQIEEIEADSLEEAIDKVEKMYYNQEIILEPGNLIETTFTNVNDMIRKNVGLISGEKYKLNTNLEQDVLCISSVANIALLKNLNLNEYIVAIGTQITKDNKLEWDSGSYYQNLSIASRRFESRTSDYIKDINTLKELLNEEAHDKYVEAVISNELRNGLQIEKAEKEILDKVYDDYMDIDDIQLVSEDIYTLFDEKNKEIENEEVLDN